MPYRAWYIGRPRWINFYSIVLTVVALLCVLLAYLLNSGFTLPLGNLLFPLDHARTITWPLPHAEVPEYTVVAAGKTPAHHSRSTVYQEKTPMSSPGPVSTGSSAPAPVAQTPLPEPTPSSHTAQGVVSQSASAAPSPAPQPTPLLPAAGSVSQAGQGLLGAAGALPLP